MIYVEFLTFLNVIVETIEDDKLMLVEVSGYSKDEQLGVPQLVQKIEDKEQLFDGILEFDFTIIPSDGTVRKQLEWNTKVIFDMGKLPENIKGVKVRANGNADIVLLENS